VAKPFVKGDPRINRKGRPATFDALRELAKTIAHEPAQTGNGANKQPVIIDGHVATMAEVILRVWASSSDFRKQQAFMEISFGKVPQTVQVQGPDGGPVAVTFTAEDVVAARERL
jgi:hypothetical protein